MMTFMGEIFVGTLGSRVPVLKAYKTSHRVLKFVHSIHFSPCVEHDLSIWILQGGEVCMLLVTFKF